MTGCNLMDHPSKGDIYNFKTSLNTHFSTRINLVCLKKAALREINRKPDKQ